MRNDTSDVMDRQARLFEHFFSGAQHRGHRLFVNFFAGHVNRRQVFIDVVPGDRTTRSTTGHKKNIRELSIAADMRADHAMSAAAMLQDGRTGAVAKKHTGVAIGPIGDRGQLLRADHEHGVVSVRRDKLLADFQSENKTGAGGGDVETSGILGSNFFLHETRGRGKEHVRRGSGDENKVDVACGNFSLLHRLERSLCRHVAGVLIFSSNAALFDAGPGGDPFVAGVDHAREIFVG